MPDAISRDDVKYYDEQSKRYKLLIEQLEEAQNTIAEIQAAISPTDLHEKSVTDGMKYAVNSTLHYAKLLSA